MDKLVASQPLEALDAKLLKYIKQNKGLEFRVQNTYSGCNFSFANCQTCNNCTLEKVERVELLSPNVSELHVSRAFELRDKGFLDISSEEEWKKFWITDKGEAVLENFDITSRK